MGHRDTGREQVFPWSSLFFFQVILLSGTLLRPQLHQMEPVLMNTQGILSHSSQSLASCWGPTSVPNLTYSLAGYIHVAYRFFQTVASLLLSTLPPSPTLLRMSLMSPSFFVHMVSVAYVPMCDVWKPKVYKRMLSSGSSSPYLWADLLWLEWLARELLGSSRLCSLALGFWIHPNAQQLCGCWRSEFRSCLPGPFVLTFKIICSIP